MLPSAGEEALQGIRRVVLTLDVSRGREQGGVETVGIAAEDEAPDQVRLEVEERTGQFVRVDVPNDRRSIRCSVIGNVVVVRQARKRAKRNRTAASFSFSGRSMTS